MVVYQTITKFKRSYTKYIMPVVDDMVGEEFLVFSHSGSVGNFRFRNCSIQYKYFSILLYFKKKTIFSNVLEKKIVK